MFLQQHSAHRAQSATPTPHRTLVSVVASIAAGGLLLLGAPLSAVADEAPPPDTPVQTTLPADDTVAPTSGDASVADPSVAEPPAAEAPPAEPPVAEAPSEEPPADEPPAEETRADEPPAEEPPAAVPPVSDAPTSEVPAGAPTSASVPVDCSTIVGANDDSSALDDCLATQQASQRGFSTMTTPENPPLAQSCGVDLVLVLDVSGSISDAGAEGVVADAANGFLGALANTGAQAAVVRFASSAATLIPPQEITDSTQVTQGSLFGNGVGTWTNWQGGLEQAAGTFTADFDPQLIVMVTDGNANSINGSENVGESAAMAAAIPAANTLKNGGAHMFAVGVGGSIDENNLNAITGGGVYPGTSFVNAGYTLSNDFSDLGASLSAIVEELCGGTVRIHKSIGGEDAASWVFSTSDASVAPTTGTTGANGWTDNYAVSNFGDADSRTITFTEATQSFHEFGTVECRVGDNPVTTVADAPSNSWSVVVSKREFVECYVTNVYTPPPPTWQIVKDAWASGGNPVQPGDQIEYYLETENTSPADVAVVGAQAVDDLSGVLEFATINETPAELAARGLVLVGTQLTWTIPAMEHPGDYASTWFTVTVKDPPVAASGEDSYWGQIIKNTVKPTTTGGECSPLFELRADAMPPAEPSNCVTENPIIDVDLVMVKTASEIPVDSDRGELIDYTLTVTNEGKDPALMPMVTDMLPEGVTLSGAVTVTTTPGGNEAGWTIDDSVAGQITANYDDEFYPGDVAVFTFKGLVGELAQPDPAQAIPALVNSACVVGFRWTNPEGPTLAAARGEGDSELLPGWDSDPSNNCDDASTPVKSIAVVAQSQCMNNTPYFHYAITPHNIGDTAANPIALIWWTPAAFDARDQLIDAGDEAAILANGASEVQYIGYPAGWTNGELIEGSELWPGAAVDAKGTPTAWPGWTKQASGTWVLDPTAPFYALRSGAVVEVRINPSTDATAVYPPATPNCNAAPTQPKPSTPAGLPSTGADATGMSLLAGLLLLTGFGAVIVARRRLLKSE